MTDLVRLKSVYARILQAKYCCNREEAGEVLHRAAQDLEQVMLSMGATPVEIGEIVREAFTT